MERLDKQKLAFQLVAATHRRKTFYRCGTWGVVTLLGKHPAHGAVALNIAAL